MLLHAVGSPQSTDLTTQLVFELNTDAQPAVLANAWHKVVQKHTSLRTGFYWTGKKGSLQFVRTSAVLKISNIRLNADGDRDFEEQKLKIIAEDLAAPFDLSEPPLMRVTFLKSDTSVPYMIWTSHHLILDTRLTSTILLAFQPITHASIGVTT